jgi:hypothetical protein
MTAVYRPRLIGLLGYAGTGKDSVAIALRRFGYQRVSLADPLREIAKKVGWDGNKDEAGRKLLQNLGVACREHLNSPFIIQARFEIAGWLVRGHRVVVTDVRFHDEADLIREHGGVLWKVRRPGIQPALGHISDTTCDRIVMFSDIDSEIDNDGDLYALEEKIDKIMLAIPRCRNCKDDIGLVKTCSRCNGNGCEPHYYRVKCSE